jgi:hypothetical protein
VIGSLPRCAHIARTDAVPIRGILDFVPEDARIPGMSDLRFRALADAIPGMRQARQDTANAVGLYGPPGFKSPILRSSQGPPPEQAGTGPDSRGSQGLQFGLPIPRQHIQFPPFTPDYLDNSLSHLAAIVAR